MAISAGHYESYYRRTTIPVESYGQCGVRDCEYVGLLGNSLCEKCWDFGKSGRKLESEDDYDYDDGEAFDDFHEDEL